LTRNPLNLTGDNNLQHPTNLLGKQASRNPLLNLHQTMHAPGNNFFRQMPIHLICRRAFLPRIGKNPKPIKFHIFHKITEFFKILFILTGKSRNQRRS
jgi:hypothetical protein